MKYRDLIMSFDEYIKITPKWPYFFSISRQNQFIYYFGFRHSSDPQDNQFNELKNKWSEFIKLTKNSKPIVLVERKTHNDYQDTLEKSIEKYGEAGAGMFFAREIEAQLVRPEPSFKYEIEELLNSYSKEEIYYSYIAVGVHQWLKTRPDKGLEEYIQKGFIDYYSNELSWNNFDFSFDNVKNIHRNIFNREFSIEDQTFFAKITNPTKEGSVINKIIRDKSMIRNSYIVEQIERYWNDGFSLFIIYGGAHAIIQEKAVRHIIQ